MGRGWPLLATQEIGEGDLPRGSIREYAGAQRRHTTAELRDFWHVAGFKWACSGKPFTVTAQERAVEIGSASLTGVRGRVAKSVAKPIARRTGLTREQVEAIIGFLILAYGIYQVVRPLVRASRRTT